mgnify:CR=1 FL=1
MDTLATTTGWSMDTQTTTGWPMDTQATSGWSMDILSLQTLRDAPNSIKRRYSPTGSFGSSDESSDQEQVFQHEMGEILVFRVDRCKIESLILGQFEPIKETAGDYFLRIGNETGTTVVWPQRLKVGAKKGKNPHILEHSSSPCQHSSGIMAKVIVRVISNETLVHEHSHELKKPEYQDGLRSSPDVKDYESFDDGAVLIQRAEPKEKKTA